MNSLFGFQVMLINLFKKIKIILIQFIFIFLIFNQQSLTEADEINDLEIEGMSIGESALKYYSKNEIQSNKKNWYKNNKYSSSEIGNIQITYKTNDPKFVLVALNKGETMSIDKCKEEIIKIVDEIENVINKKLDGPSKTKHWADKSNKSYFISYSYFFPNNDYIAVECYDWSKNVTWNDHLRVSIMKYEFTKFLSKQ